MFEISIVEDDKELSQLFQKVLEKNGYQVKSASDGAQALEAVSYTHLVKYSFFNFCLPRTSAKGKAFFISCTLHTYACLLYTSRCV